MRSAFATLLLWAPSMGCGAPTEEVRSSPLPGTAPPTALLPAPASAAQQPVERPPVGRVRLYAPETPSPVAARFVALAQDAAEIDTPACAIVIVATAKGRSEILGQTLTLEDSLVIQNQTRDRRQVELRGAGTALLVWIQGSPCPGEPDGAAPVKELALVRAQKTTPLRWSAPEPLRVDAEMAAWLDHERIGAPGQGPEVYFGRLSGRLEVPEHSHEGSWEIIAAVDAQGSFFLDGEIQKLRPGEVVYIPPGAKHSWAPASWKKDPLSMGGLIHAFQMYSPAGPEQRFKRIGTPKK